MAILLHIETATTVCSVALSNNGQPIALQEINEGYTHSENLTLFIEKVFKQTELSYKDLDAVVVSKGPGSYTGLRIGVSAAKGLCFALDKPLISLSTLKCMALSIADSYPGYLFCPMIDARRMEVYCAVFNDHLEELSPINAEIVDETSFSTLLQKNKMLFFGDGADKCKQVLSLQPNAEFKENIVPSAKHMVALGEKAFADKQFESVAYFEPFYLKDFVAGKKSEKV